MLGRSLAGTMAVCLAMLGLSACNLPFAEGGKSSPAASEKIGFRPFHVGDSLTFQYKRLTWVSDSTWTQTVHAVGSDTLRDTLFVFFKVRRLGSSNAVSNDSLGFGYLRDSTSEVLVKDGCDMYAWYPGRSRWAAGDGKKFVLGIAEFNVRKVTCEYKSPGGVSSLGYEKKLVAYEDSSRGLIYKKTECSTAGMWCSEGRQMEIGLIERNGSPIQYQEIVTAYEELQ